MPRLPVWLALTIKTTIKTEIIRCFDPAKNEGYELPQYYNVVVVEYIDAGIAIASPAHGKFSRGDVQAIYAHIKSRGAHSLYAKRSPGHRLPRGEEVTQGPFAGMWRVVL